MNAVEHIVESYFRLCRDCFTYADVKVLAGNNRQMDILAVSLKPEAYFHIECNVTHGKRFCPTAEALVERFGKKFSGIPPVRHGANTDSNRGKKYGKVIEATYQRLGLDESKVQRVWICWMVKDPENLPAMQERHKKKTGYGIEVISFRDKILPELMEKVSTANYDDEILRTFSLIKQYKRQTEKAGQ